MIPFTKFGELVPESREEGNSCNLFSRFIYWSSELKHYHYHAHGMQQPIYETNLEVSFQWFVSTEFGELVPESRE